ncbi:olfactory receptor 5G9-like [Hyperolius riggenbachi]|uniref:olfactory receptor 5G9-like n=1 Tax=Hyperolius riggenbachi TaxID=752182 RepID=UPI0035A33701
MFPKDRLSFNASDNEKIRQNQSTFLEFYFQGFLMPIQQQILLFWAVTVIYIFILSGNLLMVLLICTSPQLQTPMHIFLGNFSFTEICYTSVIIPQALAHMISERKSISYAGCLLQLYLISSFGCTECLLLSSMAYDRFLAICYPLLYSTLMRNCVCIYISLLCWVIGLLGSLVPLLVVWKLVFCGPNVINHFFCDSLKLFILSCSDTSSSELSIFFFASTILLGSLVLIASSYTAVIVAILNISSNLAKKKAFSTCASHLMVVSLFYGTLIFMYIASPTMNNSEINKGISLLYTVITPMLNPIIYSLRNNNIHFILGTKLKKAKSFFLFVQH